MGKLPIVSIIIVNYRTPQLVVNCLDSLSRELSSFCQFRVVITDNKSDDNSLPYLVSEIAKNGWDSWVTLLPLPRNGGFAYGNNRAIESLLTDREQTDYFWLLNPDTIVLMGSSSSLVDFMEGHPEIGVVGSRLEGTNGAPQVSAFRDHSIVSELLSGLRLGILDTLLSKWIVAPLPVSDTPHKADWVSGASMMVRGDVFKQVGLLDEQYFMYYEEVDFCIKARKAGWKCWYVPQSKVMHLEGAASGISDPRKKAPRRRPSYWFESRHRFFLKNYGPLALMFADILWMAGFSLWRVRRIVQHKPDYDPPHFLKDFFSHSFFCKGFRL